MSQKHKIINIAVIAHVDAGKSTLVDAFLSQSGVFRKNEVVKDCVMDSNDLEKERGITIYSKNCAINYEDYKINIVDTPGHSDFSSEVERVMKTVDTVILLVDASEGPMPQTRFVLQKSLEFGLKPILFINKIDKKDQRAEEVVNEVFDLFVDLNATDEQCEFPIIYGIAKQGIAKLEMDDDSEDLSPLFKTIVNHVEAYPNYDNEPLQFQISALAYDDYVGRLGIGRIYKGTLKNNTQVAICREDSVVSKGKVSKLSVYEGLKQVEVDEATSGEIVVIAGIPDISIGETICDLDSPLPMEMIKIEEPTLSMNFLVNDSPFVGKSGKFVTTRHLKDKLEKELEVNVGLKVEPLDTTDGYKVSGRGELHLSILLENMRREGYEVGVSKPEVLMHKEDGKLMEPIERVVVNCPEVYSGTIINELNMRKGMMESMSIEGDYVKIEFLAPTRGLLGYRSEFINATRGEGTLVRSFEKFEEFKGEIPSRGNGVLIAQGPGVTMGYSLNALSDRAVMFVDPGVEVYEGMIIGMNSRKDDMVVNPCKNKKMSNVRASGSDDAIKLSPPRIFTLEEALEFIEDDELVEITPDSIRLRKRFLNEHDRLRYNKSRQGK
ncbi:translational GTPase TypA [Clostridioides difficile]|nr:translational GTPase TypA [Clostridioides difficile]MDE3413367.1 translational GTPase TypA [Clostridioides difficile]MDE3690027.1 translational GTPase TypA [Clostridioides difficile]MDI2909591.1 translational GTPase TypA [Clostridioides difficile]MDI2972954.1 translational GTPase TypA [Clostridioides difficile]